MASTLPQSKTKITKIREERTTTRSDRDEDLVFTLPSGRTLGYARYGVAISTLPPTFYFHGFPSSRLEGRNVSKKLQEAGLTMIAVDRPGFGTSSPHPGGSLINHAEDIGALATQLGLEKYAILGMSGGGPYALACAKVLPKDRLVGVAVVAGAGTYDLVSSPEVWKKMWWVNKVGYLGGRALRLWRRIYG